MLRMHKTKEKRRHNGLDTTSLTMFGRRLLPGLGLLGAAGMLGLVSSSPALAFDLYNGPAYGNNVVVNLNTTISYTGIFRTNNPSKVLTSASNANGSEGDIDFSHGMVSDEFEILPILDIKDGDYGAHFSGEAYINTSYLGTNQNDQPDTLNPFSVARNTDFTSATRNVEGLNARLLDAFVYGSHRFGADDTQILTIKAGRTALLWGQSLFLSNNGIAAGMSSFDVIASDNTPNAQTQQKIEPTGQVVVTYQPNQVVTLQGFYQFEWQRDYLEAVGAYFSSSDILDKGGERLILGPGDYAYRTRDLAPESQNGEFGLSAQFTLGLWDLGLYGLRYDSHSPTVYYAPVKSSYYLVYPRDIEIYGGSFSTYLGSANVAGEVSARTHMNLAGGLGVSLPGDPGNANSDPLYPVGDTLAGQVSAIYTTPRLSFDPGGMSIAAEAGFNHVLKVTANQNMIAAGRSATAADFQGVVTPGYYDVLPNLELQFPIGLAYDFYGRSMVDPSENHGTGSVNFGITATYKFNWVASVLFNDYIGAPNPSLSGEPSVADRNYVLVNLQHSF